MQVESIGIKSTNIDELILIIKKGLPISSFEKLKQRLRVSDQFLSQIVNIPKRTLTRRRQQGRLSAQESEKVLRLAHLYDRALEVFEDEKVVEKWFKEPARGLGEETPLTYAGSELGAREIENLLIRIEYGVFPG